MTPQVCVVLRHSSAAPRHARRLGRCQGRSSAEGTGKTDSPLERVRSFAIITTTPNELCAQLHNRMPVVLKPEAWPVWLWEEPADQ